MAATMRLFQLCGLTTPRALTVAARIPLSLTVLALALLIEAFARRLFHTTRAGLYAALIILSSFGLYCFWRTEETPRRRFCYGFAAACALNVLTKGLIGVVFPTIIVLLYLLLTRGLHRTAH